MSEPDVAAPDPVTAPASRRGPWPLVAGVFVVVVALVCGVLLVRRGNDEASAPPGTAARPRALGLIRGTSDNAMATGRAPAADALPYGVKTEYHLQGTLPDLGATGAVSQLVAPAVDQATVATMAGALGIKGTPTQQQGSWTVTDGTSTLTLNSAGGMWNVSFGRYALGDATIGSGSSGTSGGSSGSSGASATTGATTTAPARGANTPATAIAPGEPAPSPPNDGGTPGVTMVDPKVMEAPKNLPSAADAERIARDVMDKLGVKADWKVEVNDGGGVGVATACPAGADCPVSSPTSFVTSRAVSFHRIVDGVVTVGLDWGIEIGDEGRVQGVYGILADLQKVGDYPLRTTADVYKDLVDGKGFSPGPVPLAGLRETGVAGAPAIATDNSSSNKTGSNQTGSNQTPASSGGGVATPGSAVVAPPMPTCPPGATCATPVPPPGPVGTDVVPLPTVVPPDSPTVSMPEPQPIVVTVTGAERGLVVVPAYENGTSVAYLVPTYRFIGTYADGGHFQAELVCIDSSLIATPEVPNVVPSPAPGEPPMPPATAPVSEPSTGAGGGVNPGGPRIPAVTTTVPKPTVAPR